MLNSSLEYRLFSSFHLRPQHATFRKSPPHREIRSPQSHMVSAGTDATLPAFLGNEFFPVPTNVALLSPDTRPHEQGRRAAGYLRMGFCRSSEASGSQASGERLVFGVDVSAHHARLMWKIYTDGVVCRLPSCDGPLEKSSCESPASTSALYPWYRTRHRHAMFAARKSSLKQ